jgi:hypothetical protein
MLALRIPPAIAQKYNEAIDELIITYNKWEKTPEKQTMYEKLCNKLLALEVVTLLHFFNSPNPSDYLTDIEGRLKAFYEGSLPDSRMSCGPLCDCGGVCCIGDADVIKEVKTPVP